MKASVANENMYVRDIKFQNRKLKWLVIVIEFKITFIKDI